MPNQVSRKINRRTIPPEIRFWAKVSKTEGCWLWTASVNNKGYGEFNSGNDVIVYSHRFSWMIHFGEIPKKTGVLHKCDTPRCVRPDHLFLGTQLDNMRDMTLKGRNSQQKLTEVDVRYIRASNVSNKEIAAMFSLRHEYVWALRKGATWKHIL